MEFSFEIDNLKKQNEKCSITIKYETLKKTVSYIISSTI